MVVREMTSRLVTKQAVADINNLLRQLVHDPATYKPVAAARVHSIVADRGMVIVVATDRKRIVGIGMLQLVNKFRGRYAYVEDMMVDEAYRGQGIGKAITKKLIDLAKKKRVETIELSTRPSRVAANKLYRSLGFEQKETNVYRLKL